jgi:hypothetical protein
MPSILIMNAGLQVFDDQIPPFLSISLIRRCNAWSMHGLCPRCIDTWGPGQKYLYYTRVLQKPRIYVVTFQSQFINNIFPYLRSAAGGRWLLPPPLPTHLLLQLHTNHGHSHATTATPPQPQPPQPQPQLLSHNVCNHSHSHSRSHSRKHSCNHSCSHSRSHNRNCSHI